MSDVSVAPTDWWLMSAWRRQSSGQYRWGADRRMANVSVAPTGEWPTSMGRRQADDQCRCDVNRRMKWGVDGRMGPRHRWGQSGCNIWAQRVNATVRSHERKVNVKTAKKYMRLITHASCKQTRKTWSINERVPACFQLRSLTELRNWCSRTKEKQSAWLGMWKDMTWDMSVSACHNRCDRHAIVCRDMCKNNAWETHSRVTEMTKFRLDQVK